MRRFVKTLLMVAALAWVPAVPASAASLTLELNTVFSGDYPSTTGSWLTALFEDTPTAGEVHLTLTTSMGATEFISEVSFNLNPDLDPTKLVIANGDVSDVFGVTKNLGVDAFKANGTGGYFDIQLFFPPPPGNFADKFTNAESLSFILSGISGLNALSFDFLSVDKDGDSVGYQAAAHLQGIPGDCSAWIAPGNGIGGGTKCFTPSSSGGGSGVVPEPTVMTLLGAGLVLAGLRLRRRSKS